MSLRLVFASPYNTVAYLSGIGTAVSWTVGVHYQWEDPSNANANGLLHVYQNATNRQYVRITSAGVLEMADANGYANSGADAEASRTMTSGDWWYITMRGDGVPANGTITGTAWKSDGTKINLGTITKSGLDPAQMDSVVVGATQSTPFSFGQYSFAGEFVHLRAWDSVLTDGELETERTSETAQKASALIAAPLASKTDTSNAGSAGTLTFGGGTVDVNYVTGTDYPGYFVAGGSIVPLLMAHYS